MNNNLTQKTPMLLKFWFRYTQKGERVKGTYRELVEEMNAKSVSPSETRTTLSLHLLKVYRWFCNNNRKEIPAKQKPLDTPDLIEKRLEWMGKYFDLLTNDNKGIAYIDEKWFYTTNRRKI